MAGLLSALCAFAFSAATAGAVAPQLSGVGVSGVTETEATLQGKVNTGTKLTSWHFEYGPAACASNPCTSVPAVEGKIAGGSSPVPVSFHLEGLTPATLYHFRLVAKNTDGEAVGTDHVFATRSGIFVGLPDGRAYEQSSPVDKNGGDAVGEQALVKASAGGDGITFGSTFGIPGKVVGAQGLPLYLASRAGSWSMQGLFPPAELGERAAVTGWLPDFSETFTSATKLGNPRTKALFALSTTGKDPLTISPYVAKAEYFYAGTSKDASTLAIESQSKLPEGPAKTPSAAAIENASNVYAWERATGQLRLASVFNDGKSPPQGAFAGPYDWGKGTTAASLRQGGSARTYYLQEEHAVSAAGDVYFTAAATGQLYLRRNPTEAQSSLDGQGRCADLALACTIHVSATHKTNGQGDNGADPAGPQAAAFQAASADGSKAFFTSSEKLTDDANTGAEQPPATIGLGGIGGGTEDASFIPTRAVGVAVDSKYAYWADPAAGTIGRAELANPAGAEAAFIAPGPIECEIEGEPGEFESVPASPRYVTVDDGHVYWTNTGCLDEDERPLDGGGTIGRADIDGALESVEPAFIEGASNPQGIAVNATHIYWVNRGRSNPTRTIAWATLEGDEVEQGFYEPGFSRVPYGIALSPTHAYFTLIEGEDLGAALLGRIPLEGPGEELPDLTFIGSTAKTRGIAVDATYVYWAAQGEEAIGRVPTADFPNAGPCENVPSCEKDFIKVPGALNGLAVDATHLYWAANGEAPGNPGNDLYRFQAPTGAPLGKGTLTDLTPKAGANGAEVQGVLGASEDGSRVYFAANAVLAAGATPGDCHGATIATQVGSCNLYLWQEGAGSTFVARLEAGGDFPLTDALNWAGSVEDLFGGNSYKPKTAFVSPDGATLLFRSQASLTGYDSEGVPQLYRYRAGDAEPLHCVSCPPSGEAAQEVSLGSIRFPGMAPLTNGTATVASRNLSADGNRAFFETTAALVAEDTNGQGGCPPSGSQVQQFPACLDVYEWEAPQTGSCKEATPAYSPLNGGCVYLLSSGKSEFPSLFADASESGDDVFFFTRQQLVGQDKDQLQDVYDARVGGGLAAQHPVAGIICESADACHGPAQAPPARSTPGSATFVGPGNPLHKHKKPKAGKHKKKKHKKANKQKKANAKRRAGR